MNTYRSDFGRTETTTPVNPRFLRRAKSARKNLFHRSRNGVYDPVTFYHLLDGLLQVKAWAPFRAVELVEFLKRHQPMLIWDPVTVGRCLNDIIESFAMRDAAPVKPTRRWNGVTYEVSDHPADRQHLIDMMEDMYDIADRTLTLEEQGTFPKRLVSPTASDGMRLNNPSSLSGDSRSE